MASHPVIDSPKTPGTPLSPNDITINREVEVSAPISFSDCQDLARQVSVCSKSVIEGSWVHSVDGKVRRPRFIPSTFESAKVFLRASVNVVPVRRSRRSSLDTPVTSRRAQPSLTLGLPTPILSPSRPATNQQQDMAICHGCHGVMGQGQHQGSAPGKNVCSLRHSDFCIGGIVEDPSWKPCPMGYFLNPNIQLASESGFDGTMVTHDFQPLSNHPGPAFSTPANSVPIIPSSPHVVTSNPHQVILTPQLAQPNHPAQVSGQQVGDLDRQRSRATGERIPGMVFFQGQQQMSDEVQSRIEAHRAANQMENETVDRPASGININNLRSDTILRSDVEEFIAEVVRERIPALAVARSADQHPSSHHSAPYSYNTAQLRQVSGDGIRVTADGVASPQSRASHAVVNQQQNLQNVQHYQNNQSVIRNIQTGQQYRSNIQQQNLPIHGQQQQHPSTGQQLQFSPNGQNLLRQQRIVSSQPSVIMSHGALPQQHFGQHSLGTQPGSAQQMVHAQQQGLGHPQTLPEYCYEWQNDSTGKKLLVRTPLSGHQSQLETPLLATGQHVHQGSGQYQGAALPGNPARQQQHSLHVVPQHPAIDLATTPVTYRTEFRCSPSTGRRWQVQVPVETSPPPVTQSRYEWRIHPHTGVSFQVQVPVHSPVSVPGRGQDPSQQMLTQGTMMMGQHQTSFNPNSSQLGHQSHSQQNDILHSVNLQQSLNHNLSRQERVAGIVSLLDGGGGATKKVSKVVEYAKKCPTKWSKQASMSNINLPLYSWGVTAELEASLSGRAQAMDDGVLLGKLRHLKNTLEVCCLNSSATDFTAYGWTLARDYANKVEDEVEQKLTSWQDMTPGVRTSTLVSASMEHPRPPPRADPKADPKSLRPPTSKKEVCTTYNTCTTEGKCEYELLYPDKTCQRLHECSWCRAHKKQSWKHQARTCKNKDPAK